MLQSCVVCSYFQARLLPIQHTFKYLWFELPYWLCVYLWIFHLNKLDMIYLLRFFSSLNERNADFLIHYSTPFLNRIKSSVLHELHVIEVIFAFTLWMWWVTYTTMISLWKYFSNINKQTQRCHDTKKTCYVLTLITMTQMRVGIKVQ